MHSRFIGVGLVLLFAAGCEKLPEWLPFGKSSPATAPAAQPARDGSVSTKLQITDPGVLAVANGTAITVENFRRRVGALPEDDPRGFVTSMGSIKIIHRKPQTADERAVLLDELIKEELAVQEALSLGLDRDAELKRRLEDLRRLVLLNKLQERILEGSDVKPTEVEEFYQKNPAIFKVPERIRVSQIVVPDLKQAEAIRSTVVGGSDFAELARQHSTGAGKAEGGDTGWYVRELDRQLATLSGTDLAGAKTFFPQLEPLAFALEVGQISQPIKGPDGYYIVKLDQRDAEVQKPLTQVSDQLKQALLFQKQQQKTQEYFDQIWDKNKAKVERNDRRLQQEL